MNMAAIDLVKAIIAGDTDAAAAECEMELSARAQELVQQGTEYVLNSLSQDMGPFGDDQ
ncbi:hypothetical protein PH4_000020 [Escherichia phage PH4]|jgi:hypothetical protein|nr:hypothetical protein PC3_000020 [Escherichia phage PC3]URX65998.1 hypothetical protein PH4_000020 [Escherichia phage PH4]